MEVSTTCLSSSSSSRLATKFDITKTQINRHGNGCFFRFPGRSRAVVAVSSTSASTSASSPTGNTTSSVSNGYVGPGSFTPSQTNPNRNYIQSGSCLVIPPPAGKKPRAIIKFLGGAFIGAVPELTYRSPKVLFFFLTIHFTIEPAHEFHLKWIYGCSYLTELLAKDGFLVISVPYNVTFDHVQAARQVYERFNACLDTILASGLPDVNLSPAQLAQLPLFSVGHR